MVITKQKKNVRIFTLNMGKKKLKIYFHILLKKMKVERIFTVQLFKITVLNNEIILFINKLILYDKKIFKINKKIYIFCELKFLFINTVISVQLLNQDFFCFCFFVFNLCLVNKGLLAFNQQKAMGY